MTVSDSVNAVIVASEVAANSTNDRAASGPPSYKANDAQLPSTSVMRLSPAPATSPTTSATDGPNQNGADPRPTENARLRGSIRMKFGSGPSMS